MSTDATARLSASWDLLDEAERARAARFVVEPPRIEYILSHSQMRMALSEHTGIDPRDFRFREGPNGKPEIDAPVEARGVRCNLSHSRGVAAAAITLGRTIGVDVEERSARVNIDELSQTVFSPSGIQAFGALPPDRKRLFFFAKWTLKEAFVKARGDGLTLDVKRISISLSEAFQPLHFLLDGADIFPLWRAHTFDPGPHHAGALVVQARRDELIRVISHSVRSEGPRSDG